MRLASFIVGLIGGILALLLSFLALALFAAGNALQGQSGSGYAGRAGVACLVAVALLALTSLVFAGKRPRLMGALEIVAAIVGLLLAGFFFLGGVLSIVAGILALFVHPPRVAPPPTLIEQP